MEKKWIYLDEPDAQIIQDLSKSINISPTLAKILAQRGIESFDQAKAFFRPSLSTLHDPFLMKDMDTAVNRLCDAVFNKEKILVYGDYDVDGTTSVSLVYLFLLQFTDQIEFYIPDRYSEGYGISEKGIQWAADHRFQLVIALDCGIRANERAVQSKELGIDLIICDHHLPGEALPDAFAILDPKRTDCAYPFDELSGCGVGFKLLEGFCQQNTIEKEKLFQFLDLLVVSIASDLVPIIGENRTLAYYGLRKLNHSPSAGLKSLIKVSGQKTALNISNVVFSLGPRINAAGRLSHAKESVNLLIGASDETTEFADNLNTRNKERREFDQNITDEALQMIAEIPLEKKSTVLFKESWHKGVIGIVASRCIEHYYRPTIILTESNGKATGSARSVDGFDVHSAINECSDLLEQFGGHKYAAGLTLPIENIEAFQDKFEEVVANRILPEQLIPMVKIDSNISLKDVNFKTISILSQMEPFGPQNLAPIFGTKNVTVKAKPQVMKEAHIKGFLHEIGNDQMFEFIGFGLASKAEEMIPGKVFQIAFHIEENNFRQQKSLILNIQDIKFDS
ncbi:MAG: single-stranded-DNA-specific exonuclease RecJ [Cyclobacteriaceae bacterium]